MTTLLCLGYGYCAERFVALHGDAFQRRIGTTRAGQATGNMEIVPFDGTPTPAILAAIEAADAILASAAPGEAGDPFLGPLGQAIEATPRKGPLIYLSTIGVYGNSAGEWIDETAPLATTAPRGKRRIEAEVGWQALGAATKRPVAILRLGGIYGPGRNALCDAQDGTARCIVREGQVFNRIHVDDIAGAIHAAIARRFDGAVNVVDDAPSASCAPVQFAAELLGLPPPEPVPFEQAARSMSAMALSFWSDNRRVRNERLHAMLGGALKYPSYREGLTGLLERGEV
ncbi:MAG TPA: NAD-dependent epimerase/dehydratase family protein [Ancylobacter sp.]